MPVIRDDPDQIVSTMEQGERDIALTFRREVDAMRGELTDEDIAIVARGGDLPADARDNKKTVAAILALLMLAGVRTTETIEGQIDGRAAFDQANYRFLSTAQATRDRVSSYYHDVQVSATRAAVRDAINRGGTEEQIKTAIRQSIGLTETQVATLARFRAAIQTVSQGAGQVTTAFQAAGITQGKATIRDVARRVDADPKLKTKLAEAIAGKKPIPPETAEAMVDAMVNQMVNARAAVIGQTEATTAVNQGVQEAWDQAVQSGAISPVNNPPGGANILEVDETWATKEDENVRESHALLQGVKRGPDGVWHGIYSALRYPGDPSANAKEVCGCRCWIDHSVEI